MSFLNPSPRGRVLWPVAPETLAQRHSTPWRLFALLLLAPLFCESFQYVIDCPPLYLLTKAWPLVMAPFVVLAGTRLALPYKTLLLVAAAWTIGVSPFIGVMELGNGAAGALASTSKVWALFNGLSFAAVLAWIKPTPEQIRRACVILGAATFILMSLIWMLAPQSAYLGTIESTKVFLYDLDRGYRLNIPMMFGTLFIFTVNRAFWRRPRVWKALLIGLCFFLLITIFKTRLLIAGAALGVVLGGAFSAGRWRGPALTGLGCAGLALAAPIFGYLHSNAIVTTLGGSLSIRQVELSKAAAFLNAEPWRWLTGVGSATRVGDVTLAEIVGTNFFFPSDLGWLGVVFEYGVIGAGLMLALHLYAIRLTWSAAKEGELIGAALFDYALYLLIVSPVTSVVLAPGEMTACLALGWWLNRRPGPSTASGSGP